MSSTWARRSQQTEMPTSGKRKGYQVFGAIEYFSGRLFTQGIEGRFNSESSQGSIRVILAQTTQHLFLIRRWRWLSHKRPTQAYLAAYSERITVEPLPSYSPDYKPIEYLVEEDEKTGNPQQVLQGVCRDDGLSRESAGVSLRIPTRC